MNFIRPYGNADKRVPVIVRLSGREKPLPATHRSEQASLVNFLQVEINHENGHVRFLSFEVTISFSLNCDRSR